MLDAPFGGAGRNVAEQEGFGYGVTGAVVYMSPSSMRASLDQVLLEYGEAAISRAWIRKHREALYWNLVWYHARFQLPLPFPARDSNSLLEDRRRTMVVGWQEHVVHHLSEQMVEDIVARGRDPAVAADAEARGVVARPFLTGGLIRPGVLPMAHLFPRANELEMSVMAQVQVGRVERGGPFPPPTGPIPPPPAIPISPHPAPVS